MFLSEAIKQLESLKEDRKSFLENDAEHDEIFLKDIEANEKLKEIDLTTVYIKGACDEKERWRNKIKEKVEEIKTNSSQADNSYFMNDYKLEILEELLEGE